MSWAVRAVLVAIALSATSAVAAPCTDCVFWAPAGKDPAPLLVVLHGDREHASAAAARWRAAAKKKGWALLALECPTKLGCKDSFWKWNGDPSWVHEQIEAVAADRAIDRSASCSSVGQAARRISAITRKHGPTRRRS